MNFDYIRLFLAVIVMLEHYGLRVFQSVPGMSWFDGGFSVKCFFVISGYFITLSYLNSRNLESYFLKRLKRIYPPILAVGCFMIVFGLLNGFEANWFRSVFNFLTFEELSRPSQENPFVIFTNPPFWSLVIEFQFYLILPLILGLRNSKNFGLMLLGMAIFSIITKLMMEPAALTKPVDRAFTRQSLFIYLDFFAAGIALAWFGREKIIPYISTRRIPIGDLSYGIYIYHWAVMDVVKYCGSENRMVFVGITLGLAFLSWHFLEKRFLAKRKEEKLLAPVKSRVAFG